MFRVSRKTAIKAAIATGASVVVSVSICLLLVPLLGGQPDGPGFWMSVFCPLVIAGPASAWQFHQSEVIGNQRDEIARMHVELEDMHAELRHIHEDLRARARRDPLTGGLNRGAFFAELAEIAPSHEGPAALLVADADHFKRINDSFGHLVGDEALRRIADAIAASLDEKDMWGRIGGEEFLMFLPATTRTRAVAIADGIRHAVATADFLAGGEPVPLSVSIGVASLRDRFEPADIFRQADEHLYRAKSGGRNRVVFDGQELERFQQEWEPVLRPQLHENKGIEH